MNNLCFLRFRLVGRLVSHFFDSGNFRQKLEGDREGGSHHVLVRRHVPDEVDGQVADVLAAKLGFAILKMDDCEIG